MKFEWDKRKAAINLRKHKVTFREAATVFEDPMSIAIADPDHSHEEDRCIILGRSVSDRLLVVVHADRGDNVRIISAMKATRRERRMYEEG